MDAALEAWHPNTPITASNLMHHPYFPEKEGRP